MNTRRLLGGLSVLLTLVLLLSACSGGSPSSSGSGSQSGTAASASGGSSQEAGGTGGAAAQPVALDYGPYCGPECQAALKLQAAPKSISCKVGFAVASTGFPYGVALKNQTEAAAKKYFPNMQLSVGEGQGDPAIQTSLVDDFISKGVDVLLINAVEKNALAPAVKRAMDAGIKVVSIDRTVDAPVLTTIKAHDIDLGLNAGKYVVEALGGQGNVVELQGSPAASPTIDRNKGFMDGIKGAAGIKVIASQTANYDRAQGLKVMEDILQRFPAGEIDAVFAHNDEMALGAIQAIKAAGRQGEMIVVGVDGQDSAFDSVANGEMAATVVYPVVSPMGIIAAAKACAGESMPEFIPLDSPVVTKENVAKYKGTNF